MSEKFDIIFSDKNNFESYYNENDSEIDRLSDLSNINILIGANNSGKSRFIRNFLKCKTCFYEKRHIMQDIISKFNTLINSSNFGAYNIHQNVNYQQYENENGEILFKDLVYSYNQFEILKLIDFNIRVVRVLSDTTNLSKQFRRKSYTTLGIHKNVLNNLLKELKDLIHNDFLKNKLQIFIPTLRTAHSIFENKDDLSYSKISKDIFK